MRYLTIAITALLISCTPTNKSEPRQEIIYKIIPHKVPHKLDDVSSTVNTTNPTTKTIQKDISSMRKRVKKLQDNLNKL